MFLVFTFYSEKSFHEWRLLSCDIYVSFGNCDCLCYFENIKHDGVECFKHYKMFIKCEGTLEKWWVHSEHENGMLTRPCRHPLIPEKDELLFNACCRWVNGQKRVVYCIRLNRIESNFFGEMVGGLAIMDLIAFGSWKRYANETLQTPFSSRVVGSAFMQCLLSMGNRSEEWQSNEQ
jgi:hypothetical protein